MIQAASATSLSTSAFEAAVDAIPGGIAVFDCDGTLWSGDAGSAFLYWSLESGLISDDAKAVMAARYKAYHAGDVAERVICGEMVQLYAGIAEAALREVAAEFFGTHIEPGVFPELERTVATLQARGLELWAVSSTTFWVIEAALKRYGIPGERILAARVKVEDGLLTDRIVDVPTGPGKVEALARVGVTEPDAVFGNSVHDAAMLAIARRPFPINPTPALMERSAAEGWAVYFPESVRP